MDKNLIRTAITAIFAEMVQILETGTIANRLSGGLTALGRNYRPAELMRGAELAKACREKAKPSGYDPGGGEAYYQVRRRVASGAGAPAAAVEAKITEYCVMLKLPAGSKAGFAKSSGGDEVVKAMRVHALPIKQDDEKGARSPPNDAAMPRN